jgi:hypothetical protein
MTYPVISMINGQPTFEKPLSSILSELEQGGAIKLLSPLDAITDRQRRWYKGVCLPFLEKHDENQETVGWWDDEVKRRCKGLEYLKKEIYYMITDTGHKIPVGRLTIVDVGRRNMTLFIEEILSKSLETGWCVPPPDKDLRK